jgi:hypothetical protein
MMKLRFILAVAAATCSLPVFAMSVFAQQAAAPAAAPAGGLQTTEFKPGLDDAMTMMVQPRHLKMLAAANAGNWDLTNFQMNELRSSFRRIGLYLPNYRNKPFADAVTNTMQASIDATTAAIKAKDARAFRTAYAQLTDGCNACHVFMEHAFLVIKVPGGDTANLWPDQDFKAPGQ